MTYEEKIPTPIVDKEERFMYYGGSSDQSIANKRVGFVYSDVARKLEKELMELKLSLHDDGK
jgi:hypothetical protein|tara:strand:+ start:479 stop:664 length:186 start_codon:yes stop_codon:yes gene_type:complete